MTNVEKFANQITNRGIKIVKNGEIFEVYYPAQSVPSICASYYEVKEELYGGDDLYIPKTQIQAVVDLLTK